MRPVLPALLVAAALAAPAHAAEPITAANVAAWAPPASARAASPEPAARPAADDTPRPRRTRAARPGKRRVKEDPQLARSGKRRVMEDPQLARAAALRAKLLRATRPIVASGRIDSATQVLTTAAEAQSDPLLYLAAAELKLHDPTADRRALADVATWTRQAEALIADPPAPRVAPAETAAMLEHAQSLGSFAEKRQLQLKQRRRGRGELAAGGVFLAAGLSGLGVLASGMSTLARLDRAESDYQGSDAAYLDQLAATRDRSEAMVATGIVTAIVGAAFGAPLLAFGARDVRHARAAARERPTIRVAPGFAAVSITGRF